MEEEDKNPIIEEIEKEIQETIKSNDSEFEIEIADNPEEKKEEVKATPKQVDYGVQVQRRIRKITAQKKEAEDNLEAQRQETENLKARLLKLEQGEQKQVANEFTQKYNQTKQALHRAVEEGDTDAQVNFSEQMADMRASIRVQDMQKQMQQQQQRATANNQPKTKPSAPVPEKANNWWTENDWFNSKGYERETAAARAIDVQLDLEGNDKNSDGYYVELNSRLQKIYPELISCITLSKPKAKSSIVSPSAGGSSYKSNRVRMTQDQLRMARELGINDEAGLKKYAAEIQKSQRS